MPYLVSKYVRLLVATMTLSAAMMLTAGVVVMDPAASTHAQAPAPPCSGTTCNGRRPDFSAGGYSCANPPEGHKVIDVDSAGGQTPGDDGRATIVLRYSTWCRTYWAQGFYSKRGGAGPAFHVQVTTPDPDWETVYHALASGAASETDMYVHRSDVRPDACIEALPIGQRICTRHPVTR